MLNITEEQRTTAERLIKSGYRTTSNRYRMASRIDRPDWREAMAESQCSWDPAKGMKWVNGLKDGAADFYRSVLSKDHIGDIPQPIYDLIKKAGNGGGWGNCNEYLPLIEDK